MARKIQKKESSKKSKSTKIAKKHPKPKAVAKKAPKLKTTRRKKTGTAITHSVHSSKSSSQRKHRPWLAGESNRRMAYYAMGSLALAVGLFFFIYQGARNNEGQVDSTSQQSSVFESMSGGNQKVSEVLKSEFEEAQNLSFSDRIDYWSDFLQKGNKNHRLVAMLGKGHVIEDSAPVVPNRFNCTTFVETVVALARSGNAENFFGQLMAIRYRDGMSNYASRNHFPEIDWIPNNMKAQILTDVTKDLAQSSGLMAKVEAKKIDRLKWLESQIANRTVSRGLASVAEKTWGMPMDAQVSYIPISAMHSVYQNIPNGTVMNLVHRSDDRYPVLITHQGFVIRNGDQVLFRHSTPRGQVRTIDLKSYLHKMAMKNNMNSNWPLIGVNFNQIKDSASDKSRRSASM